MRVCVCACVCVCVCVCECLHACVCVLLPQDFAFSDPLTKIGITFFALGGFWCLFPGYTLKNSASNGTKHVFL